VKRQVEYQAIHPPESLKVWHKNLLISDIKEEHGLREFENRVLRRILGPKSDRRVEKAA
jgi:hypothetical protein